ncbi:MAG TPA: Ig-like domain-containing protein [Kofleriaceae bacterium]|nr:Ig-like domain-containing protein [Kofleriaceae bacterium]
MSSTSGLWQRVMLVLGCIVVAACGGGSSAPDRIQIDPPSAMVDFGAEVVLHAQAVRGTDVQAAGAGVTWTARDPSKVQVTPNADGSATVKGLAAGMSAVDASLDDLTASAIITVGAPPITSIALTPPSPSLAKGTVVPLTATAMLADTTTLDVTGTAQWSSADETVATVTADGHVRGVAVGSTMIRATKDGITGSTMVTVTGATLVSIAVTPTNPSVAKGRTVQLSATGTFTDNTTQDLSAMVTWASANDAIAAVDANGLVRGAGVGNAAVSATMGAVSGSTTVTVTPATLVSIAVTPENPTVPRGRIQQFTATGTYTDGSTQNLTTVVSWSSSNQVIASISNAAGTNGQATAHETGSSVITASMGALTDSTVMMVTPAVLASIDVTPAGASVAAGRTRQFTAMGIYSDATMGDVTNQVTWTSTDEAIATISNAAGSRGLASGVAAGTTTIGATLAGVTGTTQLQVTDAELVSIQVTPIDPSLPRGLTRQFTATGLFSNATTLDITDSVTWTSTTVATATVSNAAGSRGLVTAVAVGTTQLRASSGAISDETTVTVTPALLVSIGVTPADPSVAKGRTRQFTAMGTFTDAQVVDLTDTVTWSSTAEAFATVSNAAGSHGLASALDLGETDIVATLGAIHGQTHLTVTAAVLDSIDITPPTPTLASGRQLQLTATGVYSDHTTDDLTDTVVWDTSDDTIALVSNAAGEHGVASGVAPGTVHVTATSGTVVGTVDLVITSAELESLEIDPADVSVAAGRTQQFTATGIFSDGSNQDLTDQVVWSSSDDTIAEVSNDPADVGTAHTFVTGEVQVTATSGTITASTTFTVTDAELDSIEVDPAGDSVAAGLELQFSATGVYSDGSTLDVTADVTWSSSDDGILSISNAEGSQGLAHGESTGQATVTAELGGVSGTADVEVTDAIVQSITIDPQEDEDLPAGLTRDYTATGTFSDGSVADITTQVLWETSDGGVLDISNAAGSEGEATAIAVGTATITASLDGVSATKDVNVSAAILQSIEVTPADLTVALGLGPQFTATGLYSDQSLVDLTDQVTWSSSDEGVLTVSNAGGTEGRSTTVAAGMVTVQAELDGVTGTTTLTVTSATLTELQVTPVLPSVALGRKVAFTATGIYSDTTIQDLTDQVLWSSTDEGVATISNAGATHGVATSVSPGTTLIGASLGGVSDETQLTVTPVALESIDVSPANPSMAKGRTVQLTATGHYSDHTSGDITADVVWTTDDAPVATVSNVAGTKGQLFGAGVGNTTVHATLGAVSGSAPVVVTAAVLTSIAVSPDPGAVPVGRTLAMRADGTYSDGSVVDITASVTWTTSTPALLSVSNVVPRGVVTGLATGIGAVRATDVATAISDDAEVDVTPAALDSIAVTPTPTTVAVAGTRQFTATGTYSDLSTRDLTNDADTLWSTSNANVATVSNAGGGKGLATGVATGGPVTITAAQAGKSGTAQLTVAPVPTVTVAPADSATNVLVTANVVGTFSVAMNPATLTVQSAPGPCAGTVQVSTDGFASCIGLGAPVMTAGNTVATVTPVGGLSYGLTYKARITSGAQSAAGIAVADTTQPNGWTTRTDRPCGTGLVISQVYGGGGNASGAYRNDFVELRNASSAVVSTNGLFLQLNSAGGTGAWTVQALPNLNVQPGGYVLIQEAAGTDLTEPALPAPDVVGNFTIGASSGKMAITNSNVALSGSTITAAVIDLVGFGTGVNAFEIAAGPAPGNSTSVTRLNGGCSDGGNNSLDYAVVTPVAHNSATPPVTCSCTVNETGLPSEMDFCNIQFPASTSTAVNVATENIYAQVYEMNVTEADGPAAGMACQIGYGAPAVNPETTPGGFTWVNGAYNVQAGNNDEYKATLTVPVAGSYRYASRCTKDGTNWTYCDLDGAGSNNLLLFNLPLLGALTVTP